LPTEETCRVHVCARTKFPMEKHFICNHGTIVALQSWHVEEKVTQVLTA